jgi:hypothetical protein
MRKPTDKHTHAY